MPSLGIDPKNDYAFKCIFGSQHHTQVLVHLLNAVLDPPPDQRVTRVDILNPIMEPVVLDDKLSILDIRASEQSGRQFNIEMQMVSHLGLRQRWLYYWSKMYGGQMQSGDEYKLLQPAISICFVDGVEFREASGYHLTFGLWERHSRLIFSDDLAIHVFQLPHFTKRADQLTSPLDLWLYILNNGKELDPDNLPTSLRVSEVVEAVEVMRRLTQADIDRARYESRERARHDALDFEARKKELCQEEEDFKRRVADFEHREADLEHRKADLEHRAADLEHRKADLEHRAADLEHRKADLEHRAADLERRDAQFTAEAMTSLIRQIRVLERLLRRDPMAEEQLHAMSVDELLHFVKQLDGGLPN